MTLTPASPPAVQHHPKARKKGARILRGFLLPSFRDRWPSLIAAPPPPPPRRCILAGSACNGKKKRSTSPPPLPGARFFHRQWILDDDSSIDSIALMEGLNVAASMGDTRGAFRSESSVPRTAFRVQVRCGRYSLGGRCAYGELN